MNINCSIVKDLLPLYEENLLSSETTAFLESHLEECEKCKKLHLSSIDNMKLPVTDFMDSELMYKKINRKLSLYQIIFVALSFFLAINTSLMNNSFGFILWYPILGLITYLFYKDLKIVFYLSFIPLVLWCFGASFVDLFKGSYEAVPFIEFITSTTIMSLTNAFIHYVFALMGGLIGFLISKIKAK